MIDVTGQWNHKQSLLKDIILKPARFEEAIELCLNMHSMVHASDMAGPDIRTFEDQLWEGLDEDSFRKIPTEKAGTIAWNLWHLTRIEDMTSNILIADERQVINSDGWLEKLKVDICDTGNAMSNDEIRTMSEKIDMKALRGYRLAVGRRTQEIIRQLKPEDMKRKVKSTGLQRIWGEGGVVEESKWLLDFWGRKNVAGLLLMPTTRHQVVHLNTALRIKNKLHKKKK